MCTAQRREAAASLPTKPRPFRVVGGPAHAPGAAAPSRRRRVSAAGDAARSLPLHALLPPALLGLATVAFCWKLLVARLVVIGYDTMTYMYPYRYFAAEELRRGHLPLWNPNIYYGAPFLANLQSAVFYPLHVLFLVLGTTDAMNWSVAAHLFLSAYFCYLAGRYVARLDQPGAVVAGAVYGFGGFVGAQVGHLNQLNAAAWLPLALLTLHRALVGRSPRWTAATAAVMAIQLLAGHAQESFMTAAALAAYAAFSAVREVVLTARAVHAASAAGRWTPAAAGQLAWRGAGVFLRAALTLGGAGLLAGGLAAMQMLPTSELTSLSIRSTGMTLGEAVAFSLPPRELFVGLLPTFGYAGPSSNEYLAWAGIGGLMLALLGFLFRVHRPATLFFAMLGLMSFLLALGNHFPLYQHVFGIPGMNLFRVPARWLMLTSLATAMLAGEGLSFLRTLGRKGWVLAGDADGPWRRLAAATRLLAGVLVVVGTAAYLWPIQNTGDDPGFGILVPIWGGLAAGAIALAFWSLAAAPSRVPAALFTLWVFVELFAASRSLEYNNPNPPSVYTEPRPVITYLQRTVSAVGTPRLVSLAATGYEPSDAKRLVDGYESVLGAKGVLATLINTKYKETLNPNLSMVYGLPTIDGYDGGVLPLRRYVQFKSLVVPPEKNVPDGLLRDQLRQVPPGPAVRTLGAEYVIADSMADVTRDGVYYDLAAVLVLAPGEARTLTHIGAGAPPSGPVTVTAVGLVTALEGAVDVPDGISVLMVTVTGADGAVWTGSLVAGTGTAEGAYTSAVQHRQPTPLGPGATGSATATYLARLPLPAGAASPPTAVTLRSLLPPGAGRVRVLGATVIGADGQSWPVTLAGDGDFRLVHRSDVKLYQSARPLPRAYLVGATQLAEDGGDALRLMSAPEHEPQNAVVLERDPGPAVSPASGNARALARRIRDGAKAWLGLATDLRGGTVPADLDLPNLRGSAVPSGSQDVTGGAQVTWQAEDAERLVIQTDAARPSLLVIRDTYYPGWSAAVDGTPAPLLRADYLFRAVPVPAGRHTVELRYHSRVLSSGLIISGLTALLTVALAAARFERRPRRSTTSPVIEPTW